MKTRKMGPRLLLAAALLALAASFPSADAVESFSRPIMDLSHVLRRAGFSGRAQSTLEARLGRPIDPALTDLGRNIFFDNIMGLHRDNSCAGCHSPAFGLGDTQSMAIGTDNNGIVGPDRTGPRNQRRAPSTANTAFYPGMMLNTRFTSFTDDPFDLSLGASVPFFIGGDTVWNPASACFYGTCFDPTKMTTLLSVQGHFPSTELVEMAGFCADNPDDIDPQCYHPPHLVSSGVFADTVPGAIPGPNGDPTDSTDMGYAIRQKVLDRFNSTPEYINRFTAIYPEAAGGNVTFAMIGAALAEFQVANTFADSPLDRFARGDRDALKPAEVRGAMTFFTKGQCVSCHAVAGRASEMFSDFENHVAGVPPIAPKGFGLKPGGDPMNPEDFPGNFLFSGPNADEDFGREEVTGDSADRYKFRTSPLRNLAVQPSFFHNGAFTRLEDALRYHLNTPGMARGYDPVAAGLDADLTVRRGPHEPILQRLDPGIAALSQIKLTDQEFEDLVAFLRAGLLDDRATPGNL